VFSCEEIVAGETDNFQDATRGSLVGSGQMSAPRMHPSGIVEVVSHAQMEGKVSLYGYGQDDRCHSPGDLLIVTTNWTRENARVQEIEFSLKIRGRQMNLFVDAAKEALLLWDDNKHWLNASMSQPGDARSMKEIRSADQAAAIKGFYDRNR
jgi:hypothetical protein